MNRSVYLLFYIRTAFRQYLALIDLPDTLQIRGKIPVQYLLSIDQDFHVSCRRMYLSKLRKLVKIGPL